MARLFAREWLWLIGCTIAAALCYATYETWSTLPVEPPPVAAMLRRHFPGAYAQVSDVDLEAAVLKQYPHYPALAVSKNGLEFVPIDFNAQIRLPESLQTQSVEITEESAVVIFPEAATDDEMEWVLEQLYPLSLTSRGRVYARLTIDGLWFGPLLYLFAGIPRISVWALRRVRSS